MQSTYLFPLEQELWFQALSELDEDLEAKKNPNLSYRKLLRQLANKNYQNLLHAFAESLIYRNSSLSEAVMQNKLSEGLELAALADLELVSGLLRRDWHGDCEVLTKTPLVPLDQLSKATQDNHVTSTMQKLRGTVSDLWLHLKNHYKQHGTGLLAKYNAFKFSNQILEGIAHPVDISLTQLQQLESQVGSLKANTEAFLKGFLAQHCLLYGPRGSGKSTAVRALLKDYASAGLRLVELAPYELNDLEPLMESLRGRPHFYIIFVDDLSFDADDNSYQPLKTLLEGSITQKPSNTLIYATSNRRNLVKEQFSDRPDPLNDDVHGWDTQNEKLALSDRFGLSITFPSASQKRYLEIVTGLAKKHNLDSNDLRARAIRYAEWGNGYSGRTAQQFITSSLAGLA